MKLLLAAFAVCAVLPAQTTPLSFDSASIRAHEGPFPGDSRFQVGPASLNLYNVTLLDCVRWAWDLQPPQLQGPEWMDGTRFTVNAKSAQPVPESQLRQMLQGLLIDRFQLKVHRTQKELPVYVLTLAKGEPKFHDSAPKDSSRFLESPPGGAPVFTHDASGLVARNVRITDLAEQLSEPLRRPVVDKTGLKGRYDIRIDVTGYMSENSNPGNVRIDDPLAAIFGAFQSQIGMKLESGKDTVDMLVVDSGNKEPTEN